MKLKKLHLPTTLLLLVAFSFSTFAKDFEFGDRKLKFNKAARRSHDDKNIVDGGFLLLLGFGVPSYKFLDNESYYLNNGYYNSYVPNPSYSSGAVYKAGVQYSLEIGYQFMIYTKPDKFGIGINASWLTMGVSNYARDVYYYVENNNYYGGYDYVMETYHYIDVDFRLLKVGPHATVALGKLALDGSFNVIPITANFGLGEVSYAQYGFFNNFSFDVRARFKIFTAGFNLLFGKTKYSDGNLSGQTTVSNITPKFVVGFRF